MSSLLLMHRGFLPDQNELALLARHAMQLRTSARRFSHEQSINTAASRLFGRGLEFEELRAYQPGDDIRSIDWRATARTGKPHTKKYREDRQQVLILMLEVRNSMLFGSRQTSKCAQAVRVAALSAFAMQRAHARVGAMLWGDFGSLMIPPSAAGETMNRLLDVLSGRHEAGAGEMSRDRHLAMMPRGRRLIFISDFIQWQEAEWHLIERARGRHEAYAVHVRDPREEVMPDIGLARFTDIRGEDLMLVDTSRKAARDAYVSCWRAHMDMLRQRFADAAIPLRCVSTGDDMAHLASHMSGLIK